MNLDLSPVVTPVGVEHVNALYAWARETHPLVEPKDILGDISHDISEALRGYSLPVALGMRVAQYAGLFETDEQAKAICERAHLEAVQSADRRFTRGGLEKLAESIARLGEIHRCKATPADIAANKAHWAYNDDIWDRTGDIVQAVVDCDDSELDAIMARPFLIAIEEGLHDHIEPMLEQFVISVSELPAQ